MLVTFFENGFAEFIVCLGCGEDLGGVDVSFLESDVVGDWGMDFACDGLVCREVCPNN